MSFPRYERYKDSGVDWLGEVPEHWDISRVKRATSFLTGWTPPSGNETFYGGDNLWANISDLGPRTLTETSTRITGAAVSHQGMQISPAGSLLFSFKLSIGQVSFAAKAMYTNEAIASFLPDSRLDLTYAYYAWPLFLIQNAGENIYGAKLLNQELIRNALVVLPNLNEQRAIAGFLDEETKKIDDLIEEQRRLIELLKEKRQAVISHAVTRGLNPNVSMSDTGIKWIGLIPGSWKVTRVKYAVSAVVDCLHTTPTYDGDLVYPAIRTADVEPGRLLLSQARLVSEDVYLERIQRLEPDTNDILYSREGERFGMAALVPSGTKVCLGQRMMMFRPHTSFDPSYLMWTLNSSAVYQQVIEGVTGPTAPHVNIGEIINFMLPMPELAQQEEISKRIQTIVNQTDELVSHAQDGIGLLQERRTALISAAVTGKIDVRNYKPKEAA